MIACFKIHLPFWLGCHTLGTCLFYQLSTYNLDMTQNEQFLSELSRVQSSHQVRITTKKEKSWLWKTCDILLRVFSLGKRKNFLTETATTLGDTIYFPIGWDKYHANHHDQVLLHHELIHVYEMRRLGIPMFLFLYLFVPLPIGLAWWRFDLERTAFLRGSLIAESLGLKTDVEKIVDALTGVSYLWAWPFKKQVRTWFEDRL